MESAFALVFGVFVAIFALRWLWRMAEENEKGTRQWWAARCNVCRGRGECFHWY